MKTKSRIAPLVPKPNPRCAISRSSICWSTKTEPSELALRPGLKVFTTMLEEDRTAICELRH